MRIHPLLQTRLLPTRPKLVHAPLLGSLDALQGDQATNFLSASLPNAMQCAEKFRPVSSVSMDPLRG